MLDIDFMGLMLITSFNSIVSFITLETFKWFLNRHIKVKVS